MGDTAIRTKEQIAACLELMEAERESVRAYDNKVSFNHFNTIVRILRWVLKKDIAWEAKK